MVNDYPYLEWEDTEVLYSGEIQSRETPVVAKKKKSFMEKFNGKAILKKLKIKRSKMNKRFSIFIMAVTIVTGAATAQDFSGHYTQQSKEMIDGIEYLNAIATEISITQTKDSLKLIRVTPGAEGKDITSTETLALDGKPVITTTASKRQKISTVAIGKDGKSMTITYTLSYAEMPGEVEFKNTETWTLNGDGTLTIEKLSDATVTDDWTIRAIFKKQ